MHVYINILWGIYELKQEDVIAYNQFLQYMYNYGYKPFHSKQVYGRTVHTAKSSVSVLKTLELNNFTGKM